MFLSQHEQERLLIHVAADVARRRRERGLRLNHPEATAIIPAAVDAVDSLSGLQIRDYPDGTDPMSSSPKRSPAVRGRRSL